ncbi:hypothetical protein [Sphingomonas sp. GC_Shp_3]|uniref:hypothetical protein n=1 Tax=Sphingomonas sp. GC_Shp_3 TaxID=2937383 RepID=UPI00226A09B9|nr:hypothetical protein [Sphingomonas sp. GC_Shp_3]
MLFTSPLQLLVLCAVAVVAWLLGFATNPNTVNDGEGMRKLMRDFATFRAQSQSRLNTLARHAATLEATHQAMVDRLAEAETRIATFRAATPAPAAPPVETAEPAMRDGDSAASALDGDPSDPIIPPLTPGETAAPPPIAEAFPELASGVGTVETPFVTEQDALTRIDGIDAALAMRLSELGIARFADIEHLSDQDEMALELRLALPAGYITGRQWRQQAAALRVDDLGDRADRPRTPR